jgi:hypothetical protein
MAVASHYEQRQVAARLRSEGLSVASTAEVLRERYGLGGLASCRQACVWSQREAALRFCSLWPDRHIEQKTLSGWEAWPHGRSARMPSLHSIGRLAQLYTVSASDLFAGWADFRTASQFVPGYPAGVDRRSFLSLAAGIAAVSLPTRGVRVGSPDVEHLRQRYWALWHADEAQGGGAVHDETLALLDEVQGIVDRARYGPTLGRELRVLAGYLQDHVGFTAYDVGDHVTARHYFNEALTTGRVTNDDPLSTYALAELANQAAYLRRGREVIDLTQAAQHLSRGFARPRLAAVLLTREAEGHALCGNAAASQDALGRAETELADAGDDSGNWYAYFTPEVFHGIEAHCWLALGSPVAAERAARASRAGALPRRPGVIHTAVHAHTLVAAGQLDHAASVTVQAVNASRGIASARMRAELLALAPAFEGHDSVPGVPEARHALASV